MNLQTNKLRSGAPSNPIENRSKRAIAPSPLPVQQDRRGISFGRDFGTPEQIQKITIPLYGVLGTLVLIDFLVPREHAVFIGDSIPGFSALYALIATLLIIFVSKFLGRGLMKSEDYYGGRYD